MVVDRERPAYERLQLVLLRERRRALVHRQVCWCGSNTVGESWVLVGRWICPKDKASLQARQL